MTEAMPIKALAPWFGGKRTLAPRIVAEMGKHKAYFEPFCGSCAVLFAKPECAMEVVNDLYGDLINFARVIASDRHSDLSDRLGRTLTAHGLFEEAKETCHGVDGPVAESVNAVADEHVDRAYWWFTMSWMGRNGSAGTDGTNITPAMRYTSNGGAGGFRFRSACNSIPGWHERLKNVQITRRNGIEMLERIEDKAGTVVYCDPPYVKKGAKYVHDFIGIDHHHLAERARRFKHTRVVVSYYDHPLVRELYKDWTLVRCGITKSLVNQGMRDAESGTPEAPEVLFINGPSMTGGMFQ